MLKETSEKIDVTAIIEDCPNCGVSLANNLQMKSRLETTLESSLPKFQTAYDLTRFKIDIEKLGKLMALSNTGSLCISGDHANLLLTRLMVRSLLPANHGGLGSMYVVVVDAGNKSDFYLTVKFVKQYGMNLKTTLDRIVVSRTFTIYQLKSLLLREVPKIVQQYQPSIVVIPGLLDLFADPNIKKKEAKKVIARIMQLIKALADKLLVIISLNEIKYADLVKHSFDKRIEFVNARNSRVCASFYNGKSHTSVTLMQRELPSVQKDRC